MVANIDALQGDLAAETAALLGTLSQLDEAGWDTRTPAVWSVRTQIAHLIYFDEAARHALVDPDAFRRQLRADDPVKQAGAGMAGLRKRTGQELATLFAQSRVELAAAFASAPLDRRVPWYGPDMGVASALTARIMETWAHGQDIYDALGLDHPATGAVRQVADIGVRTLKHSFASHKLEVPTSQVRVELLGPDDEAWTWGDDSCDDRVGGLAVEFCLVVTRRRHRADTDLRCEGSVASTWLDIAQAYAGPPGRGREPGQFKR